MTQKKDKVEKVKWPRSKKGEPLYSKCGRFVIEPVDPDEPTYAATDLRSEIRSRSFYAQSDAKAWCQDRVGVEWPRVAYTFIRPRMQGYQPGVRFVDEPRAMNRTVDVVRYRVVIEPVDEPKAIAERLQKLWRVCDNQHMREPIYYTAQQHGVKLEESQFGVERKSPY